MRLAGVVYSGDLGFNDFLTTKRDFCTGNFSPNSLLKPHDDYLHDFELFVDSLKSVNMSRYLAISVVSTTASCLKP